MAPRLGVITDVSLLAASSCAARDFVVVDVSGGWTAYPAEQFHVNDTLGEWVTTRAYARPARVITFVTFGAVFVNNKDMDAVLLVSQSHYGACNTSQPFLCRESRFVLNNTGYHYFISADAGHCRDGERLIVLAIMHKKEKGDMNAPSPAVPPTQPPSSPPSRSLAVALKQTGVLASCLSVVGAAIL
jgi:hypothetical protein